MSYLLVARIEQIIRSYNRHKRIIIVRCVTVTRLLSAPDEVWPLEPSTEAQAAARGVRCLLADNDVLSCVSPGILYHIEGVESSDLNDISLPSNINVFARLVARRLIKQPTWFLSAHMCVHRALPPLLDARVVRSLLRRTDLMCPAFRRRGADAYASLPSVLNHLDPRLPSLSNTFGLHSIMITEHFQPPAVSEIAQWIRPSSAMQLTFRELNEIASVCASESPRSIPFQLALRFPHVRFSEQAMNVCCDPSIDVSLFQCAEWFLLALHQMLHFSTSTAISMRRLPNTPTERRFWAAFCSKGGGRFGSDQNVFTVTRFVNAENDIANWIAENNPILAHHGGRPGNYSRIAALVAEKHANKGRIWLCANAASVAKWRAVGFDAIWHADYDGPIESNNAVVVFLDAHMFDLLSFAALVRRHHNIVGAIGNVNTPASTRGSVFRDCFLAAKHLRTTTGDDGAVGVLGIAEAHTLQQVVFRSSADNIIDATWPVIQSVASLPRRTANTLWIVPTNRYSDLVSVLKRELPSARHPRELRLDVGVRHVMVCGEVRAVRRAYFADLITTSARGILTQMTPVVSSRIVSLDEAGVWFELDAGIVDHRFCCNSSLPNLMSLDEHRNDCEPATVVTTTQAARIASESFARVVLVGLHADTELVRDDVFHACRIATQTVVKSQCAENINYEGRRWAPRTDLRDRIERYLV